METTETLQVIVSDYRRKVRLAYDDVSDARYQLVQQEKKLESMMDYQRECEKGFLSLPSTAFYYAQRRECKLLLNHLTQEMERQHDRVQSCYERIEQYEQLWRNCDEQLQLYQARLAERLKEESSTQEPMYKPAAKEDGDDPYSWIHIDRKI